MTGINWFGFETQNKALHGLWSRSYKSFLNQIVSEPLGFNVLRIPFSNEMLLASSVTSGINFNVNPELVGKTPIQVLDEIINYCGTINLRVFLDRHSSKADNFANEDIWYIPGDAYYTEDRWIADWVFLADRYKNNPVVIGADLFNEPKKTALWASWRPAAQRCGNAIHAVNPNWLIIVEGTEQFNGASTWWGGNLMGVKSDPIALLNPNKLVYSAHEYPSSVFAQTWFSDPTYPANMGSVWRANWGYIYEENIAPVLIGEFGTKFVTDSDKVWLDMLTNYMDGDFNLNGSNGGLPAGNKGLSFTFWCLNPNSGDTGGILNDDWTTVNAAKLAAIKGSLAPLIITSSSSSSPPVNPAAIPTSSPLVAAPVSASPTRVPTTATAAVTTVPSMSPVVAVVASLAPTASPTSSRSWSQTCMCQYSVGCLNDQDCCSGQVCTIYGAWSQCNENTAFKNKASLPNPNCKATSTTLPLTDSDFRCGADSDCCNPSAVCGSQGLCVFPTMCSRTRPTAPVTAPVIAPVISPVIAPVIAPVTAPVTAPVIAPVTAPVTAPATAPSGSASPLSPLISYNPYYVTRNYYVNPSYQSSLSTSIATSTGITQQVLQSMMDVSSAYWLDVKSKILGATGTDTLEGILRSAAQKPSKQLVTFIIYDLPNRDCHAKASNGEICCTYNTDGTCNYSAGGDCSAGIAEYQEQYINPISAVLAQYQNTVEIVLIIEPDSLPNLATNMNDPHCGNIATTNAYKQGTAYAINKFKSLKVTMYLDAGHGGWLGWVDNMQKFTALVLSMNFPITALRGFATNVANYQPIGTMCTTFQSTDGLRNDYCLNNQHGSDPCCADPCSLNAQYNPANNELNFAQLLRRSFLSSSLTLCQI